MWGYQPVTKARRWCILAERRMAQGEITDPSREFTEIYTTHVDNASFNISDFKALFEGLSKLNSPTSILLSAILLCGGKFREVNSSAVLSPAAMKERFEAGMMLAKQVGEEDGECSIGIIAKTFLFCCHAQKDQSTEQKVAEQLQAMELDAPNGNYANPDPKRKRKRDLSEDSEEESDEMSSELDPPVLPDSVPGLY